QCAFVRLRTLPYIKEVNEAATSLRPPPESSKEEKDYTTADYI
ncbi:unnamed protein product, partial [marine sediment metagenome]